MARQGRRRIDGWERFEYPLTQASAHSPQDSVQNTHRNSKIVNGISTLYMYICMQRYILCTHLSGRERMARQMPAEDAWINMATQMNHDD